MSSNERALKLEESALKVQLCSRGPIYLRCSSNERALKLEESALKVQPSSVLLLADERRALPELQHR